MKSTALVGILFFVSIIGVCLSDRYDNFREIEKEFGLPRKFFPRPRHHQQHHGPSGLPTSTVQPVNQIEETQGIIGIPASGVRRIGNPKPVPEVIAHEEVDVAPSPVEINPENLCPPDVPQFKIFHRYFNETGKCYTAGKGENPCGENMQFYSLPGDDVYGDCDCKPYAGCDYRPLIYWPSAGKCYHLFEQGPCKAGEWLIFGQSSNPTCARRTCPVNTDENPLKTWFSLNSTCYQLSTNGFCENRNDTVHYEMGELVPKCFDTPIEVCGITKSIIAGAPSLPCGPGQKKSGSGACGTSVGFV